MKPHVARAGHAIATALGLVDSLIGGFRPSSAVAGSDHPKGLALDFTTTLLTGDRIAAYVLAHRAELGVTYVIWRQRINYGSGWQAMADRGGVTANHFDHVHVSFSATPAGIPTC